MTSEREKFEAWAVSKGFDLSRWTGTKPKFAHQHYDRDETQIAWESWQAARQDWPSEDVCRVQGVAGVVCDNGLEFGTGAPCRKCRPAPQDRG